jgi:hypothetical protein
MLVQGHGNLAQDILLPQNPGGQKGINVMGKKGNGHG